MFSSIIIFFRSNYLYLSEYFAPKDFSDEDLKALAASVHHIEKCSRAGKTDEISRYFNKLFEEIQENKTKLEGSRYEMDPDAAKDYKKLIELDARLTKIRAILEKDFHSKFKK